MFAAQVAAEAHTHAHMHTQQCRHTNTCPLLPSQGMHGKMVDGRALNVRVRSEPPGAGGPGGRRGLGAPRPEDDLPPECKLYVGSLPHHVDDHALTQEFGRFGPVVRWAGWGGGGAGGGWGGAGGWEGTSHGGWEGTSHLLPRPRRWLVNLCACCFSPALHQLTCPSEPTHHSLLCLRSARVINDRETGRPRGFGFVNMAGD